MKGKTVAGWLAIVAISAVPVMLWFLLGRGAAEFSTYGNAVHSFGELFGLVGMTLFALTFVLSTRISWIEDVFGGLDKVYITHGILGGTALILLLAHPIFLVLKFIPNQIDLAAIYLLPSGYWSVDFGIIALMGLIVLIFITLFSRMKYHRWKFTHEFLGLVFLFAVLHVFLVRGSVSQDNIFSGYYWYVGAVSSIGLAAFAYSLFIKGRFLKNAVYRVAKVRTYGDHFEIAMAPEHKPLPYKAGQFVFVRFYNERLSGESHPFSIASKSNAEAIVIIVKRLGDYTSLMEHLKPGDKVSLEGPYGRFNYDDHSGRDQVWIAAGIGVTPFLGIAQDLEEGERIRGRVYLYYTARKESDLIGYYIFEELAQKNPRFSFIPWESGRLGRLTLERMTAVNKGLPAKEFFLCGPTAFKEGLIAALRAGGVPMDQIHEEAFDFR